MRSDASLLAKIAFVGAWLGVLAGAWLIGGITGWLPELLGPSSSLWLPAYATLTALGVASVVLSVFTLKRLSLNERKWAFGGFIGGALVIMMVGLLIWVIMPIISGLGKI